MTLDVEIEDDRWVAALPDCEAVVRQAALTAAEGQGGVTILLTDDEAVADLNSRFRDRPCPTNVLSFPAAPNRECHLGDIALALGVCTTEATAQGKTLANHLRHLVIHGVLHLLGYDHHSEADAERMETLERRLLAGLGTPDPYAEDVDARR